MCHNLTVEDLVAHQSSCFFTATTGPRPTHHEVHRELSPGLPGFTPNQYTATTRRRNGGLPEAELVHDPVLSAKKGKHVSTESPAMHISFNYCLPRLPKYFNHTLLSKRDTIMMRSGIKLGLHFNGGNISVCIIESLGPAWIAEYEQYTSYFAPSNMLKSEDLHKYEPKNYLFIRVYI